MEAGLSETVQLANSPDDEYFLGLVNDLIALVTGILQISAKSDPGQRVNPFEKIQLVIVYAANFGVRTNAFIVAQNVCALQIIRYGKCFNNKNHYFEMGFTGKGPLML